MGWTPPPCSAAAHRAFDEGDDASGPKLDYLVLADPDLEPGPGPGPARLLIAAWVGGTRLIDNMAVWLAPVEPAAHRPSTESVIRGEEI